MPTRLRCPKCGHEMNRHAEKVVYSENPAAAGRTGQWLGGVLEETHGCPQCGNVEARRVSMLE